MASVRTSYGQEDFADGVKVFYDAGELACVALDAVTGPQVFLADFPRAGRDPEQAHQHLLDHAAEHGNCLLYTPDHSLSQIGGVRLTRPLVVIGKWLESEYYRDHLPLEGTPAPDESASLP
ncbi:hypothetical protein [Streptomyces wuyuanensis]|uniref:hypothetical protein n=1 Tax=Streptomyces wuyuanensis TaxID=1196353 RepID=UPI00381CD39C